MRGIRPDDADALVSFHQTLSSETTQPSSFMVHERLSAAELVHLASVDHADGEAFVAVRGRDIVGVARFDRIDGTDVAEIAFVVADPWQGGGVEAVLFQRLVERARNRGIAGLDAVVPPEHQRMLEVFRHAGLTLTRRVEEDVVRVAVSLVRRRPTAGSRRVGGDLMKWQRTSVRYITRYRSTDARYTIESIGGSNARWHLRRQRATGSDLVGVYASARDASAAAEADAAGTRARHPDEPGTGQVKRPR